jgi:hypothetical protein
MLPKWVPNDMEWFRADLIQQFDFANGDNPVVWVNEILIRADSLENAHKKALSHGERYNETYTNSDGVLVTVRFRGLKDLYLIYDKLEDGAELLYSEFDDLSEADIAAMITPKEKLAAFEAHDPNSPQPKVPRYRLGETNGKQ